MLRLPTFIIWLYVVAHFLKFPRLMLRILGAEKWSDFTSVFGGQQLQH